MPTGLMLIGNKHDLDEMNEREVSTETGETFAKVSSLSPPPPVPLSSLSPPLSPPYAPLSSLSPSLSCSLLSVHSDYSELCFCFSDIQCSFHGD